MSRRIQVVAHRGASAVARENSPAAAAAAIAAGADAIEMDARLSADGVAHVAHDPDLGRIAGIEGEIARLASAEIAAHLAPDGGAWVPALSDLLAAVAGRKPVVIDVKLQGRPVLEAIAAAVPPGMAADLVIGVRALDDVAAARALLPRAAILGFLPDPDAAAALAAAGGQIIRLWEPDATDARVAAGHAAGLRVWVTAGRSKGTGDELVGAITADRLCRVAALGIDGILVNDPAAAIAVLQEG